MREFKVAQILFRRAEKRNFWHSKLKQYSVIGRLLHIHVTVRVYLIILLLMLLLILWLIMLILWFYD